MENTYAEYLRFLGVPKGANPRDHYAMSEEEWEESYRSFSKMKRYIIFDEDDNPWFTNTFFTKEDRDKFLGPVDEAAKEAWEREWPDYPYNNSSDDGYPFDGRKRIVFDIEKRKYRKNFGDNAGVWMFIKEMPY